MYIAADSIPSTADRHAASRVAIARIYRAGELAALSLVSNVAAAGTAVDEELLARVTASASDADASAAAAFIGAETLPSVAFAIDAAAAAQHAEHDDGGLIFSRADSRAEILIIASAVSALVNDVEVGAATDAAAIGDAVEKPSPALVVDEAGFVATRIADIEARLVGAAEAEAGAARLRARYALAVRGSRGYGTPRAAKRGGGITPMSPSPPGTSKSIKGLRATPLSVARSVASSSRSFVTARSAASSHRSFVTARSGGSGVSAAAIPIAPTVAQEASAAITPRHDLSEHAAVLSEARADAVSDALDDDDDNDDDDGIAASPCADDAQTAFSPLSSQPLHELAQHTPPADALYGIPETQSTTPSQAVRLSPTLALTTSPSPSHPFESRDLVWEGRVDSSPPGLEQLTPAESPSTAAGVVCKSPRTSPASAAAAASASAAAEEEDRTDIICQSPLPASPASARVAAAEDQDLMQLGFVSPAQQEVFSEDGAADEEGTRASPDALLSPTTVETFIPALSRIREATERLLRKPSPQSPQTRVRAPSSVLSPLAAVTESSPSAALLSPVLRLSSSRAPSFASFSQTPSPSARSSALRKGASPTLRASPPFRASSSAVSPPSRSFAATPLAKFSSPRGGATPRASPARSAAPAILSVRIAGAALTGAFPYRFVEYDVRTAVERAAAAAGGGSGVAIASVSRRFTEFTHLRSSLITTLAGAVLLAARKTTRAAFAPDASAAEAAFGHGVSVPLPGAPHVDAVAALRALRAAPFPRKHTGLNALVRAPLLDADTRARAFADFLQVLVEHGLTDVRIVRAFLGVTTA